MTSQRNIKPLTFMALAVTVLVASVTMTALAASINSRTVPSRGEIKSLNVSVYWNSACTNATSSIDWGVLTLGTTISRTIYVRNEGNVPLKLSMIAQNWNPTNAASYLSTRAATLSLSVAANTAGITSFTFDIIIAGTE
jgi:hypothetical protein